MSVCIICADVIDGLRELPDDSVHCVVTSPLNPEYAAMAGRRIYGDCPLFTEVAAS